MIQAGHYYRNKTSNVIYYVDSINSDSVFYYRLNGVQLHWDSLEVFSREFEYYNP